ncbi:MAG: ribokinase [Anaerolinea sp.]|nr:ribokinase [Anaerolinea sp.]
MADLKALIPRLAGLRILVVGDVILDEYVTGRAMRMSREAPIPVLEFESRQWIAGGAANPAANIAALGSMALQVGVVGTDSEADALRSTLTARGIDVSGIVPDSTRPTTIKTRVMAHMGLRFPQQVARLDKLSREPISAEIERALVTAITAHLPSANALLFSDYDGGVITPSLIEAVRAAANGSALLAADAQGNFDKYSNFGLVKCNADDARAYLRRELQTHEEFAFAARDLRAALNLSAGMVITRGGDGATVGTPDGMVYHCPAPAITDVYDTVGAGDTSIAVLTLAYAAGASLVDAALLANYASGIVVRRVGNYAPTPDELAAAIHAG